MAAKLEERVAKLELGAKAEAEALALVEQRVRQVEERQSRQDGRLLELEQEQRESLRRIEAKVDRLLAKLQPEVTL